MQPRRPRQRTTPPAAVWQNALLGADRTIVPPSCILATSPLFNKSPITMSFPSMSSLLMMANHHTSHLKRTEKLLRRARANSARELRLERPPSGNAARKSVRQPAPARVAGLDRLSMAGTRPLKPRWPPLPYSLQFLRDSVSVFRSKHLFDPTPNCRRSEPVVIDRALRLSVSHKVVAIIACAYSLSIVEHT